MHEEVQRTFDTAEAQSLYGRLGLGQPDLVQGALGLGVLALRQLGEHVGGLVHPAALLACFRPHPAGRLPEAEPAVGDPQLGRHLEPAPLEPHR